MTTADQELVECPEWAGSDGATEARARRLDSVFDAYADATPGWRDGESSLSASDLSWLLADIQHWCEQNGVDFFEAEELSYVHYLAERNSGGSPCQS